VEATLRVVTAASDSFGQTCPASASIPHTSAPVPARADQQDQFKALLNEALPLDNFEQRKSELQAWKDAIQDGIRKFRAREPDTTRQCA